MSRFLLRRLLVIPVALVAVNFIGFVYAHAAQQFHAAQNPFGAGVGRSPAIWPLYVTYAQNLGRGEFGQMPAGVSLSVAQGVWQAAGASLGLLALAFVISLALGLLLGLRAVRAETASVAGWLMPVSTLGLATPSFYIGTLFIVGAVYYVLRSGPGTKSPFPLQGFGWDVHLALPLAALCVRPIMQIAQVTGHLLAGEMAQQYVVAARSRGNSWRRAQWRHALQNVLAPVLLTIAASLRLLVGELIIIEWLFGWPGLGRLLALALIPPNVATPGGLTGHTIYFLYPQLVAALLTVFTFIFLMVDTTASTLVRWVDPRLRASEPEKH